MYLLDTNIVSELRRPRPQGAVTAWIEAQRPEKLAIAAPTIGEIALGIERTRKSNPARAAELAIWLDGVSQSLNVLAASETTFRIWGQLAFGKAPAHFFDLLIAATAIEHGLMIATRNVRDFDGIGLRLVNPFDS